MRRFWSAAEDDRLRSIYSDMPTSEVAKILGRSICGVNGHAQKLGLVKTQAYLDSPAACRLRRSPNPGIAFRFPKGHVPANKGMRMPGWAPGRMAETEFKKGQVSRNAMPMWSFRMVDGYLMLKTGKAHAAPNTGWEYVHRLIWEQANGPLPHWTLARLWWKDGDHLNCALSNLELLAGKDHVARTTVHRLPEPLRRVIQLTGVLKRKIRKIGGAGAEEHARRSA